MFFFAASKLADVAFLGTLQALQESDFGREAAAPMGRKGRLPFLAANQALASLEPYVRRVGEVQWEFRRRLQGLNGRVNSWKVNR
jgi:hypothetical protein